MTTNTPRNLVDLVNTGAEPTTSSTEVGLTYKCGTHSFTIPPKFTVTGSKQVSVKMDTDDYAMLRYASDKTEMNHREIFLEAFSLWVKANAAKLK